MTLELDTIVGALATAVPGTIGAVLCDFEGETVVAALGDALAPDAAEVAAQEHVPKAMALTMPIREFLVRLAGAEPCGLLRMFQASASKHGGGALDRYEVRYDEIEMLVDRLPNDFYVVMVLRRPALTAHARYHLLRASEKLSVYVE